MALLRPAQEVAEAVVVAVAARDMQRARRFADKHGIMRVQPSYEALINDPEVDAVYIPLPNSLHCEWTIRALQAGKHVLCEKPIAANAAEAERMADAARQSGRILMEAFHWRYHPLAERMKAIVDSGELGKVRHIEAHLRIPLLLPGDIRYRLDLAGGALMDTGCYAVSIVRYLAGAEPEVVRAEARLSSPGVDRMMTADLRFADGRTGRVTCSLFSAILLRASAKVDGESGAMTVVNPIAPQLYHRLRVRTASGARSERLRGEASYTGQLRAFVTAVRSGIRLPTGPEHGIANMRVLDEIYRRAGLSPRGQS